MQQEGLQGNWAVVCAYRLAPKLANGHLKNGEVWKLQDSFFKTRDQINRIIRLVRSVSGPTGYSIRRIGLTDSKPWAA